MSSSVEKTVLETNTMPANWSNVKPKIIEFYGFEGEDFRYFRSVLETFFSLSGITQDNRRVNVLRTQLRRSAGVFFDKVLEKKNININKIAYSDAIHLLQAHYITERLIQNYELAFNEMTQSPGESPQVFLSRLYEAADLAEIQEEKLIHSRFRAGLLPALKTFCREQSASTFEQWVKHADGWWNAHAPQGINLVENPFVATPSSYIVNNVSPGIKNLNEKSVRFSDERVEAFKDVTGKVHKLNNKMYSSEESPTVAALTAKLEALDLHQLIPYIDSNENANENVIKRNTESLKTDNGLKTFIKNIVQEVVENDMKDKNYNGYYDNRKNQYRKPRRFSGNYDYRNEDYFDNDAANPTEGYYPYRRRYNNYNDRSNYNNNGQQAPYQNNSYQKDRQNHQTSYQYKNENSQPYNNNQYYNNRQPNYYNQGSGYPQASLEQGSRANYNNNQPRNREPYQNGSSKN
jgi:hypothetical protein